MIPLWCLLPSRPSVRFQEVAQQVCAGHCVCFCVEQAQDLSLTELYFYFHAWGDMGKASVRWAALMWRNAEIPQWLCGSAVSPRPAAPPSDTPDGTMGMNRTGGTLKALPALPPLSFTHILIRSQHCAVCRVRIIKIE